MKHTQTFKLPSWYEAIANSPAVKLANTPSMQIMAKIELLQSTFKVNQTPQDRFTPNILRGNVRGCDVIEYEPAEIKPLLVMPEAKTVINHYIPIESIKEAIAVEGNEKYQSKTPLSDRVYKLLIWLFNRVIEIAIALLVAYFIYQLKWN